LFHIKLKYNTNSNKISKMPTFRNYNEGLDDGRSVIQDICEIFDQTKKVDFIVSGFGQNYWPVDCQFDLPVVMEQLPQIMSLIRNNY
jgi:hypothetical protein